MNVGLAVVLSALMLVAAIPFALALTVTGDEEFTPGDQLTVSGTAGPNADITFKVSNPNGAQVAVGQTAADANGEYSTTLLRFPSRSTATFPFGSYTVTATADEGTADLTVTFTEESAAPAASSESGGIAVAVSADGTYNPGDTVTIFVLTTTGGVAQDSSITVAKVTGPGGSETITNTCSSTTIDGLQQCTITAGNVGSYGVAVQAGGVWALGSFQVSAGVQIDIPEAESNAPILSAIANLASDVGDVADELEHIDGEVHEIAEKEAPEGVSLGQISSALDAAVADVTSAISGSQSAIEDGVEETEDDIESAIEGIVENANAAAEGSAQASSTALIAAVLAAIAVILQVVVIVRGNVLKN